MTRTSRKSRLDRDGNEAPPNRRAVALSLAGFLGGVLLNLQHLALWCPPVAVLAALWCWRAALGQQRLPGRSMRIGVVVTLTVGVLASFRTLNGLAAGATLLAAMGALKLLEARRGRDWLIVVGVAVFLLLAACLDRQALWRLPLYAAELWLLCAALHALGTRGDSLPTATLLRASGRGLLLALPLAILLFLFFPRLPGSFWALPQTEEALTGLGDEMSPGSISRLTESDDEALRVRFEGPLPPPAQRYWRGPVLHNFDGYTWRRARGEIARQPALQYDGTAYRYDVTLEPNQHNVLIALELPTAPPAALPFAYFSADYQLLVPQPMNRRLSYSLESYPEHQSAAELSTLGRRVDLALPRQRNPRTLQLALQLHAAAPTDAGYIDAVLDYFRRGGFVYTLTPPKLDLNSVDDFLFNTRQGFCGHYASAFVALMRAGGLPARVVTGYLGGEWNPFGNYLLLRQSHAHAWAEVWLPGRGWMRVDPTAAVAPERLTRDVYDLLPATVGAGRRLRTAPWIGSAVQIWEAANAWWQDEFLGFNFTKQLNLIDNLGFSDAVLRGFALLLGGGFAIWALCLACFFRPRRSDNRPDPLAAAWRALERKLKRARVVRAIHEGPLQFAARAAHLRPPLAAELMRLGRQYAQLRYGRECPAAAVAQFRRDVRVFSVSRSVSDGANSA